MQGKRILANWPVALALVLFVGFWVAAFTGLFPSISPQPHRAISKGSNHCATHECREDAAANALAFYTEILACFTGVLAVVSFVQGIFLYRADRASKVAADRASQATKESMELANRQFALEGLRADTAQREHGLLREQFVATNRPQLKIRSIVIARQDALPGTRGPLFEAGQLLAGHLVVVNAGDTAATIVESSYRFFWSQVGLPMAPPLDQGVTDLFQGDIPPLLGKESRLIEIGSTLPIPFRQFFAGAHGDGWELYLIGAIRYADISFPPKERYMGFGRIYIRPKNFGGDGSFEAIDNPDYEYSD